jgi:hypothetical protein
MVINDISKTEIDEQIATLVACIREYRDEAERYEAQIREAKDRLILLLEQRGSNWSDEYGYARIAQEGTRLDYDTNELDALILNDPLRYGWLKEYRRIGVVPSRLMVR